MITIIFIVISFQEFRLNGYLHLHQDKISAAGQTAKWQHILRVEGLWNMATWVIIILLFVLPDSYFLLLASILLLIEAIVVHQMDQIKSKIDQLN